MDVAMLLQGSVEQSGPGPSPPLASGSGTALKRRASSSFEDREEGTTRKRPREDMGDKVNDLQAPGTIDGHALADELEQELQCGCCSALVYRPVVVSPCQHFFCGSCIVLWIRNGGTNCPACRGMSNMVSPSRPIQTMADILVRAAPSKARSVNERMQADEIYKGGITLRIPTPRLASPEPSIPQINPNFVHPCPHCIPGNQYDWRCPQPIVDPEVDPDGAWRTDDGSPPGHGYCGNCESVLAMQAPSTTKCDFCQVSFCGIGIPSRCVAAPVSSQHMHGLADIGDLIQCGEIYEIFDGNSVEVDIMFDYLQAQSLTPRHIYREIISMIQRTPRQFAPLIESDLFVDVHGVAPGIDPEPSAPRNRICRMCATEILLWGLREWWIQERKKGFLDEALSKRPDCPEGSTCSKQREQAHAKEFNHIIGGSELARLEDHIAAPHPQASLPQQEGAFFPDPMAVLLPATTHANQHTNPFEGLDTRIDHPGNQGDPSDPLQLDLLKEEVEPSHVARQSSIFKLLSPVLPSAGTSAPPNVSDRDAYLSQEARSEVEAMI